MLTGPRRSPASFWRFRCRAAGPTARASPCRRGASRRSSADDADLLEAAAWLHDIGYSPELAGTGFHPLDGARWLRDVQGASPVLCRLVANHTGALIEAEERGLAGTCRQSSRPPDRFLSDALTYCDMTTSPDGRPLSVDERLADIRARYGTGHIVSRAIDRSSEQLRDAVTAIREYADAELACSVS